jgi:hypothetical protein
MKIKIIILIVSAVAVVAASAIVSYFNPPVQKVLSGVKEGVSINKLETLPLGSTKAEVIKVLAEPIQILSNQDNEPVTWFYSKRVKGVWWQPAIFLRFKSGKLIEKTVTKRVEEGYDFVGYIYSVNEIYESIDPSYKEIFSEVGFWE